MNRMISFIVTRRNSTVIAAAVTAVVMSAIYAADPAAATKLSQCQRKHVACTERCLMRVDGIGKKGFEQGQACIERTCDKQNPGCGPSSFGGKGGGKLVDTKPKGNSRAAGVRAPRGTGVLGSRSEPANRNPANVKPRGPGTVKATGIFIR